MIPTRRRIGNYRAVARLVSYIELGPPPSQGGRLEPRDALTILHRNASLVRLTFANATKRRTVSSLGGERHGTDITCPSPSCSGSVVVPRWAWATTRSRRVRTLLPSPRSWRFMERPG